MTERQVYEVLATYADFELRRYPEHIEAETEVSGPFFSAGNRAFMTLARFIGGHNRADRKIAMTAPVLQERSPSGAGFTVSFVMPLAAGAEVPEPLDSSVRLRRVPAETAAALRFSGRWTSDTFEKRTEQLLAAVDEAGFAAAGVPRYARYDPPWTPWPLRTNEVVLPVVPA